MRTRTRLAALTLALVAPFAVTACSGDAGEQVEQEVEQEDEEDDG